jgi:UDP-N-acetylglucosamine 2-epimerase (non-hydrolysing)
MIRVLVVLGTRPEAVKLCPLVLQLRRQPEDFQVSVCVTAQHRAMLDQVLSAFDVIPDHDLNVMQPDQTLAQTTARIIAALEPVITKVQPDLVLVQGDTATTLCGALTAFYQHVPIGHVEAGLRTWDMAQPFPEEMNRVVTARLATLHFAATDWAARNLLAEGLDPARIHVTGNPGIEALLLVRDRLARDEMPGSDWRRLDPRKKLLVVTAHRRESFGPGLERVCEALARLAARPDVQIVYPVHRNPHVVDPVSRHLGKRPNVLLVDPLDYVPFVDLMRRAYLLLTDSGGIQEEAPSLGKPVLVLREKTERPEAVESATARLVGTDAGEIVGEATRLLDDPAEYALRARVHHPYGDGHASARITGHIRTFFEPAKEVINHV